MLSSTDIPAIFSAITPSIECVGNAYSSLHSKEYSKYKYNYFPAGLFHIYSKDTLQREPGIAVVREFGYYCKRKGLYWEHKYSYEGKLLVLIAIIVSETELVHTSIPKDGVYYPDKSFINTETSSTDLLDFTNLPTWNMQVNGLNKVVWKTNNSGNSFPIAKIHDPRPIAT